MFYQSPIFTYGLYFSILYTLALQCKGTSCRCHKESSRLHRVVATNVDFLKALAGGRVAIGVVLFGQLAEGLSDVFLAGADRQF